MTHRAESIHLDRFVASFIVYITGYPFDRLMANTTPPQTSAVSPFESLLVVANRRALSNRAQLTTYCTVPLADSPLRRTSRQRCIDVRRSPRLPLARSRLLCLHRRRRRRAGHQPPQIVQSRLGREWQIVRHGTDGREGGRGDERA